MKVLKNILFSAVVGFGLVGTAQAADFGAGPDQYSASGQSGWYLRGDVGWGFLDWNGGSDDNDVTFGGGVGYRYNENLRTDVRADFAGEYNVGGGTDLGFGTALVNGYFDFPLGGQITPYLGVGAGYGWTYLQPGSDRSGFAYSLMAGASFDLTQQIALDVGYRYRQVLISGSDVADHSALAGVRFSF